MLQNLLSTGLVGLIFGLGWSPSPRRFRELSSLVQLPIVLVAAFIGSTLSQLLGVDNTSGIDYTAFIIDCAVGYLLALLAVWTVARVRARAEET